MAVLTINHYINQVSEFISDVEDTRRAYYVFTGRPQAWPTDSSPPAANDSLEQIQLTTYDDMLYGKRIANNDIIHMIPRYDWVSNTAYAQYDQNDSDLYTKQFYVVTDKFEVYKCVDNNSGAKSTVKPSLASTSGIFSTSDGYIWKYMFTVDSASNTKFTSTDFIPLTANATVESQAVPGTIDSLRVTNGGNNYQVYETGFIDAVLDKYTIQLPNTSSSLDNFYTNSSIYLKSGLGGGQIREIASSNGINKTIRVSSSDPFNTYMIMDLANVSGSVSAGYTVIQPTTYLSYLNEVGFFNVGITVDQTDTGASGNVIAANASTLQVSLNDSTKTFQLGYPIYDNSQAGILKVGGVTIANTGKLSLPLIVNNGSGYTANATITITANSSDLSAVGGVANAQANSIGKISNLNITSQGTAYFNEAAITISAPANTTFNANSAVLGTPDFAIALSSAGKFIANDEITYRVAAGNTALTGLVSGTTYFVDSANSTHVGLKPSLTGSRIAIEKGLTQTGHALQGKRATGRILSDNVLLVGNTSAQLNDSSNGYANGDYIRVGTTANTNFRRIVGIVNSTYAYVDVPFLNSRVANVHYNLPIAATLSSITVTNAYGTVANLNLNSQKLTIDISNTSISIPGRNFYVGEKVRMVDSANVDQSANGIVAFSNTTALFLSSIAGTWVANLYVRGESSLQTANIVSVATNPNITVFDPTGDFALGKNVQFVNGNTSTGSAKLIRKAIIPNDLTEYVIGPTVKITGDGSNALAIGLVNTNPASISEIVGIDLISEGNTYSFANIQIYANSNYGNGATATATISPIKGHGAETLYELGGRYAGISVTFDTAENEGYYFQSYGKFRRIGVLQDPQFEDVQLELTDLNTINLSISNKVTSSSNGSITTWVSGEYVVQSTANVVTAAGIVTSGNNSSLQLIKTTGTFNANSPILAVYSNTSANVVSSAIAYFQPGTNTTIISQVGTGAKATVKYAYTNTSILVSNVVGQFIANDIIFNSSSNAYGRVTNIYTANGTRDSTTNFTSRFDQTLRITLTSNTSAFTNGEYVSQETSLANGRIVSTTNELDLAITGASGSFALGQTIVDQTTNANGIILDANSSYIKLTAVSQNLNFAASHLINTISGSATISAVYPVLLLNDINGKNKFQASLSNNIIGTTSTARGICNNYSLIIYPELVRESGKVIYMENFQPVTRSTTSKEEVRLVIKF